MDKHIDIGAILENAPKGLNLYSPAYGDIKLVSVDPIDRNRKATPMICCKSGSGNEKKFFRNGTISTHGECMLFLSKDNRSWERWQEHNGYKYDKNTNTIISANEDEIERAKNAEEEVNNQFQEYKLFNVDVLKPFDKVLYLPSDGSYDCWKPGIVSMVVKNVVYLIGMDRGIRQCIPFEGNEHLIGEIAKAKDFYIKN
jgi:hypothetical protein